MATPMQDTVAGGSHWRIVTANGAVHVWVPASALTYPPTDVVVFLHGYGDSSDSSWSKFKLAEQFAASGRNAIFVVAESPSSNEEQVQWGSLDALLGQVQVSTGLIRSNASVTVVSHSGAYRTVLGWLKSPRLMTVILLDSLYAGPASFAGWARQPGHKLINITIKSGKPHELTPQLGGAGTSRVENLTHFGLITPPTSVIPEVLRRASGGLGGIATLAVFALVVGWFFLR